MLCEFTPVWNRTTKLNCRQTRHRPTWTAGALIVKERPGRLRRAAGSRRGRELEAGPPRWPAARSHTDACAAGGGALDPPTGGVQCPGERNPGQGADGGWGQGRGPRPARWQGCDSQVTL